MAMTLTRRKKGVAERGTNTWTSTAATTVNIDWQRIFRFRRTVDAGFDVGYPALRYLLRVWIIAKFSVSLGSNQDYLS
jgi:hypothetical protein